MCFITAFDLPCLPLLLLLLKTGKYPLYINIRKTENLVLQPTEYSLCLQGDSTQFDDLITIRKHYYQPLILTPAYGRVCFVPAERVCDE